VSQTDLSDAAHETPIPKASSIADPAPLGLASFAMTTFVLMCVDTGWLSASVGPVVLGLALAYGGISQFTAGIWEFAKGNTFGATAFCSFGAFWVSYWWLSTHLSAFAGVSANDVGNALGVFLLGWAIFTGYMTVAATRVSGAVLAVFALLTLTFLLLSLGNFTMSDHWTKAGGYVGLLTALAAWYASFAGVTNFTFQRTVFPTAPR
jgi:succinate-acetate transporter protein